MTPKPNPQPDEWEKVAPRIQQALADLDCGSIEIVVRNAHVALVERQKKSRFEVIAQPPQNRKE